MPGELLDSRLEFIVSMEMVDMVPARLPPGIQRLVAGTFRAVDLVVQVRGFSERIG